MRLYKLYQLSFLFVLLVSCGQTKVKESVKPLNLYDPKEETMAYTSLTEHSVSVVLLSETAWFCYPDTNFRQGVSYLLADFPHPLDKLKIEYGDSISILLKPTMYTSAKTQVDALDAMSSHKIKNYQIVKLGLAEENYMYGAGFLMPPEPVKIEEPKRIAQVITTKGPALYIQLKKDNTIWYKTDTSYNKNNYRLAEKPHKENLERAIAMFKKQYKNEPDKINIYIIGDKKTTYNVFETVMESLKKNNIYKYQLITADE